jgi:hypothetical protein
MVPFLRGQPYAHGVRRSLRTALAGSLLIGGLTTVSLVTASAQALGTASAGSVKVTLTASRGTPGAKPYPVPTITSLSRASGPVSGGNAVTITGSGFSTVLRVAFGTTTARSFTYRSVTQLVATTPPHAVGPVRISVTTPGGTTSTSSVDLYQFTVPAPVVSSISPSSGPASGGTTVTVGGSGFTGATTVYFGASKGGTVSVNAAGTQFTVKSPLGTPGASVNVEVKTPEGESPAVAADFFTYGPTITSISRANGPVSGGTKLTITGNGFITAQHVKFGTTTAEAMTVKSASQIVVTSPGGSGGTVNVTVTVDTVTSAIVAADKFTYEGSSPPNAPVTVTVAASQPEAITINQDLIGFNHVPAGSESALAAIGTRWARTDVSFETSVNGQPVYNCTTGAWNPQVLDANVAIDREAGATPELIVDYTPPCLATDPPAGVNPNYTPPDIGPDMAKWQALVYQMALHEIRAEGVRVFEVWNEPNGEFWVAPDKISAYLTLYQATATSLEAAASALGVPILVGGPALAGVPLLPYLNWIDQLCSFAVANNLPLDFISWHEYSPDDPSYGAVVAAIRAEVSTFPTPHPLLWLDEWNTSATGNPAMSGSEGAAFVAAELDSAQAAGLDRATFYEAADDSPVDTFGVLTQTLAPKFDYQVFAMWHEMAGAELGTSVAPNQAGAGPQGQIGAVASTSGGAVDVLVYNYDPTGPAGSAGQPVPTTLSHLVTVSVTGLPLDRHYSVSRTLVDPDDNPSNPQSLGTMVASGAVQFTQTGQSVSLLVLTPTS